MIEHADILRPNPDSHMGSRGFQMDTSNGELLTEREERIDAVVRLQTPDRVPIGGMFGFFPAKYKGLTLEQAMYEEEKMIDAWVHTTLEFAPDLYDNPYTSRFLGPVLEALDYKALRWPGHGVDVMSSYQFVEGEYMMEDEYEAFLADPTDHILRKHWPRTFGKLEAFGKLPPLHILSYYLGFFEFAAFGDEEVVSAMAALQKAALEFRRILSAARAYAERMKGLGFPPNYGAMSQAPFDTLSDFLRGTKGSMLDLFRHPDQVLEATRKLLPVMLHMGLKAKDRGVTRVFIPIHKGLDGFMSQDQFKTFFWPTLQELIWGLVDAGLTPSVLWEGNCTSRLEIIGDIPKGTCIYHFEATDIFRAKEVLGDVVCLRGNVPLSLLWSGTRDDVEDYCKKLIDIVGKRGGFILDSGSSLDDANPINVQHMINFTKKYGIY